MKRILSLFLVMILMLAFVACGDKSATDTTKPDGDTGDSIWGKLVKEEHYDNVTIVCDATFLSGYEYAEPENSNTFKFDGDAASIDGELADRQATESLKAVYHGLVQEILSKNDGFIYDKDADTYLHKDDITCAVNSMGYETDITVRNVVITLDSDGELSKIACEMDQAFVADGEQMKYVLNVEFTFSDFGTTVVE